MSILVKDQYDLIDYWSKNAGGIALAYEFTDGSIIRCDSQPCHQGLGKADGMISSRISGHNKSQKDISGIYIKLSHGANVKWSRQWWDFIGSPEGPWRSAHAEIITDESDKYVAMYFPHAREIELQVLANLAFASRVPYQRAGTLGFWADLYNKYDFHPVEALFAASRLCYNHDGLRLERSTVNHDFLFKGSQESVVSFRNLWNGTPQVAKKGRIHTAENYGLPNDIWIEYDKVRAKSTDFLPAILRAEKYTGIFRTSFVHFYGRDNFPYGAPDMKMVVEHLKKEAPTWPRK